MKLTPGKDLLNERIGELEAVNFFTQMSNLVMTQSLDDQILTQKSIVNIDGLKIIIRTYIYAVVVTLEAG